MKRRGLSQPMLFDQRVTGCAYVTPLLAEAFGMKSIPGVIEATGGYQRGPSPFEQDDGDAELFGAAAARFREAGDLKLASKYQALADTEAMR